MYFIGVDLGTSAVKLLLMDEEGKIVNIVSREYPLYFPHPGWSEQKPEDWWEQSKEGIRDPLERRPYRKTDRLSEHRNRKRKTLRVHRKHCICRLYRTEDSLGERK